MGRACLLLSLLVLLGAFATAPVRDSHSTLEGLADAAKWSVHNSVPTGYDLYRIAEGPSAVVAVGDAGVIIRSIDQGESWVRD